MTLRTRIALISAGAVAVALVAFSLIAYRGARTELLGEVDVSLRARAELIANLPQAARDFRGHQGGDRGAFNPILNDPFGRSDRGFDALYFQVVSSKGTIAVPEEQGFFLPVEDVDLEIATGSSRGTIRTVELGDGSVRMITVALPTGALQVARSLDEVDATLGGLSRTLWLTGLLGAVAAAGMGLVVARSALKPVAQLTDAAEHVAETQELAARIEVERTDELGRLAASFNAMLDALESSRAQQHRLVRDASHELRTPLTALRTNLEVLAKQVDELDGPERVQLLGNVTYEVEQLSELVTELVDLATDSDTGEAPTRIRLGELATEIAARYERRSGHVITVTADGSVITGMASRIERAISNLVDNAVKWSPAGSAIEISVGAGRVGVTDHGPGIDAADAERIFDRFYRADSARTLPGSGLGLSIVDQIVEDHHGEVFVEHPAAGGVTVGFRLPVA